MIHIIKGNILDVKNSIICHQVNCYGVMGVGLAKQIKLKYNNVYLEYCNYCKINTPSTILGTYTITKCYDGNYIANLYSQLYYGYDKNYTNYNAFEKSLNSLIIHNIYCNNITIPYGIGCGLAGGNWEIVYKIIEKLSIKYNTDIYIYKL